MRVISTEPIREMALIGPEGLDGVTCVSASLRGTSLCSTAAVKWEELKSQTSLVWEFISKHLALELRTPLILLPLRDFWSQLFDPPRRRRWISSCRVLGRMDKQPVAFLLNSSVPRPDTFRAKQEWETSLVKKPYSLWSKHSSI